MRVEDCKEEKNNYRFQVNINEPDHLTVTDQETGCTEYKEPIDMILNNEYKLCSQDDILKIGFMCGQILARQSNKSFLSKCDSVQENKQE